MRKIIIMSLLLISSSVFARTHANFAVIDMQKIISTSPMVSEATQQIKTQFSKRHEAIVAEGDTITKDFKHLSADAKTLSKADQEKQTQALAKRHEAYTQKKSAFQQEVFHAQEKKMHAIMDNIKDVVKDIAKHRHFELVMVKSQAMYVGQGLDITEEVMDALR